MTKEIPLTQGLVTIVDDEDYEWKYSMLQYANNVPDNVKASLSDFTNSLPTVA